MDVEAWCGRCGESFRLAETVYDGYTGLCPRCGLALSPDYAAVASAAVHEILAASASLHSALGRLADAAPRLHINVKALLDELAGSPGSSGSG